MQRRYWNQQEDQALKNIVEGMSEVNWTLVSLRFNATVDGADRNAKQCRERWLNKLMKQSSEEYPWSSDQDKIILQQFLTHHNLEKNKWILISDKMNKNLRIQVENLGRTPNQIKNRFYSIIRKGLRRINNKLGRPISAQEIRLIKPNTTSKILQKLEESQCRQFLQIIYNMSSDFPELDSFSCQITTQNLQKILTNIIKVSRSQKKTEEDTQQKNIQKPRILKKRRSSLSTIQQQFMFKSNQSTQKSEKLNFQNDYVDLFIGSCIQESISLQFQEIDFGI